MNSGDWDCTYRHYWNGWPWRGRLARVGFSLAKQARWGIALPAGGCVLRPDAFNRGQDALATLKRQRHGA
jgi:hypothetical protein